MLYLYRTTLLLVCLTLLCAAPTRAQSSEWEEINPGAGGQVQDIVPDPTTKDRVFLASDMEGIYRSLDNGLSWKPLGSLLHNRVYSVTVDPNNAQKIYAGSLYGLEISTDNGTTFNLVEPTRGVSIDVVAVKPNDSRVALAGVGTRDDLGSFANTFGLGENGPALIYRSKETGGWERITLATGDDSQRAVYTIQFDPSNPSIVYAGAYKGVFKSTDSGKNWTRINGPGGANYGVAVTPNGQYLYGVFNHELYVTRTDNINWQKKTNGLPGQQYWYPEVDPRSTGNTHNVILAVLGDRDGLYEGTFNPDGTYNWRAIFRGLEGYDYGWDEAAPNPRVAHYTPNTQGWDRAIWSTSNQTIFRGVPAGGGNWQWQNRYSIPNTNFSVFGQPTYSSRGTASTYTFDIAVRDNYIIQAQADNGWMESWDKGASWSNLHMRRNNNVSDVPAADIGQLPDGTGIVIAPGTQYCYGGICFAGNEPSQVWLKRLSTSSPSDTWKVLPGSGKKQEGFPDQGRYRDVAVSPAKKDRVFLSVNNDGIWMIDNLQAAWNGDGSTLKKISLDGPMATAWTKDMAGHPTNPDIVFCAVDRLGLFRGTKGSGTAWTFQNLIPAGGNDGDVETWVHNGQVYVAYAGVVDGATVYHLSTDGGNSFKVVMTPQTARDINTPAWYSSISNEFRFASKGGLAGTGNTMYTVYYDHRMQKAYGIYKGTIASNGTVSWENFTGDIHFGGATNMRIVDEGSTKYLYMSTAGAGAVRRRISGGSTPPATAPSAPSGLNATGSSSSRIDLSWTDNSTNETGFRIERKQGSGSFAEIGTVAANVTTYASTGLSASTTYTYRIRAYNATGNSAYSGERSATTQSATNPNPCTNPNLVANGELDNLNGWQQYVNGGAGASATFASVGADLSGSKAAKITITSGQSLNDIQFYTTVSLLAGKTYEVIYRAKAAANRNLRVQLLENGGSYTGYGEHTVSLGTGVKTYSFEVTMPSSNNDVRLDYFLGGSNADVWIDAVVVREKCNEPVPQPPSAPTGLTATAASSSRINLSWTDNSGDETGFRIERKQGSGSFSQVGTVGADVTTYASTGLSASTAYTYRVRAYNGVGNSAYSGQASATTQPTDTPDPCNSPNLVTNGEFNSLDGWRQYVNTAVGADATFASVAANLSGAKAAKIGIKGNGGPTDSDVQFYTNLGLTAGRTYEVSYRARGTQNRSMRVQLLQEGGGWTNYGQHTVDLTASVRTYSFELTMPSNDDNARLDFFLGGSSTDVFIDAVAVREKCLTTSIQRQNTLRGGAAHAGAVLMYPNPVARGLPVYVEIPAATAFQITVLSADGRVVQQQRVTDHPGGRIELLTSGIGQAGVYLVRVRGEALDVSERLLIR